MEKAEAIEILSKAGFQDDNPDISVTWARSGKEARLSVIRQGEKNTVAYHCAAIEISRHWRGHLFRKQLKRLFKANDDSVAISPEIVPLKDESDEAEKAESIPKPLSRISSASLLKEEPVQEQEPDIEPALETEPVPVVEHRELPYVDDEPQVLPRESEILTEEDTTTAAPSETVSAKIQPPIRKPVQVKKVRKPHVPSTKAEAATVIQRAWRRHIDMQVFRYYRDLINFRRQGNPALMLRCINPAEAKILDAATGTHIKFRLAGEKFPPNIYYKIFTHRPVVDMCANSPKDYTKAAAKQPTSKQIHTKDISSMGDSERDGWYMRYENNGWRLVSDRLIHAAMDPTTWETSKKTVTFHHSKLQRKSDLDKRRRQKKIAWMQKMYRQGMLQVKLTDPETSDLVQKAADGLMNTVDLQGPDGVMDWEVDELLQWTTALNFDDYLEGWKETATSNVSEYEIEELLAERSAKQQMQFELPMDTYAAYADTDSIRARQKHKGSHMAYGSSPVPQPADAYGRPEKYI